METIRELLARLTTLTEELADLRARILAEAERLDTVLRLVRQPTRSVWCEVMRLPRNSEDRGAWSAVGGAVFIVAIGAAVAFWAPAAQAGKALPWEVYGFGAVAIGGLYLAVAPLLRLMPWHDRRRGTGSIHIPKGEVPLYTASRPLPSEEELARIAASRDPRFAQYGMVKHTPAETVQLVPPNSQAEPASAVTVPASPVSPASPA
jgi:hypothetical protein